MAAQEWDWFQREELIGQISDIRVQNLQVERENIQKRTFTRWMNLYLEKLSPPMEVKDLLLDIQDGKILMALLEVLSGQSLLQDFKESKHRIFRLNNIAKALQFLEDRNVKLISIDAAEIADGNCSMVLGLIWNIILFFQIKELTGNLKKKFASSSSLSSILNDGESENSHSPTSVTSPLSEKLLSHSLKDQRKAIKVLLHWVKKRTRKYGVEVQDFGSSWKSGLAFLAIIKSIDPTLVDMTAAADKSPRENLEDAFKIAFYSLGIPRLLEPEDVMVRVPDEQSLITYVSQFLEHFPELETEDAPEAAGEHATDTVDLQSKNPSLEPVQKVKVVQRNGDHLCVANSNGSSPPPPKIFVCCALEDDEYPSRNAFDSSADRQLGSSSEWSSSVAPEQESSENVQDGPLESSTIQPKELFSDEKDMSAQYVKNSATPYLVLESDRPSDLTYEGSNDGVTETNMSNSYNQMNVVQKLQSNSIKLNEPYGSYTDVLVLKKLVPCASAVHGAKDNFKYDYDFDPFSLQQEHHPHILSDEENDAYRYILDINEIEDTKKSSSMQHWRDGSPGQQTAEVHYYLTECSGSVSKSGEGLSVGSSELSELSAEMSNNRQHSRSNSPSRYSKVSVIPLDIVYYPHYNVPISDVIEAYVEPDMSDSVHKETAGHLSASCLEKPSVDSSTPNKDNSHSNSTTAGQLPLPDEHSSTTVSLPVAGEDSVFRQPNVEVFSALSDAVVVNNEKNVQLGDFTDTGSSPYATDDTVTPETFSQVHSTRFAVYSTPGSASVDGVLLNDDSELHLSPSLHSVPSASSGSEEGSHVLACNSSAVSTADNAHSETVDGIPQGTNSVENSPGFVACIDNPEESGEVQPGNEAVMEQRYFECHSEAVLQSKMPSESHEWNNLQPPGGLTSEGLTTGQEPKEDFQGRKIGDMNLPEEGKAVHPETVQEQMLERENSDVINNQNNSLKCNSKECKALAEKNVYDRNEEAVFGIRENIISKERMARHHLHMKTFSSESQSADLIYLLVLLWMFVYCLLIFPQVDSNQMPYFSNEQ